jgi:hypothetical protein
LSAISISPTDQPLFKVYPAIKVTKVRCKGCGAEWPDITAFTDEVIETARKAMGKGMEATMLRKLFFWEE